MKKCFHVHLKRIVVGLVDNSKEDHGAYRCEDCGRWVIADLKPLSVKVNKEQGDSGMFENERVFRFNKKRQSKPAPVEEPKKALSGLPNGMTVEEFESMRMWWERRKLYREEPTYYQYTSNATTNIMTGTTINTSPINYQPYTGNLRDVWSDASLYNTNIGQPSNGYRLSMADDGSSKAL